RIMIGECRGGEALDLLQALNTGHGGSMSTIHANSPREALGRLEVLTLLAGLDLPVDAVRGQIASAFQLVVQTRRFEDGSRKVCCVSELTGLEGGRYRMQDLFQLDMDSGIASQDYRSCLSTPSCIETTIGVVKRPWIEHFQNDRFVHEQQSSHANAAGDDRRMGSSLLAADLGQLAKVAA
ncbi:MAG: CpaF family protein, partial [Betaproteobacteria bacterium]|nr:CpaF family protein [Betaproteobacteria bacterium]